MRLSRDHRMRLGGDCRLAGQEELRPAPVLAAETKMRMRKGGREELRPVLGRDD